MRKLISVVETILYMAYFVMAVSQTNTTIEVKNIALFDVVLKVCKENT